MAEGLTGPGDFIIEELKLVTTTGLEIDLSTMVLGITIFENIFSMTISGTVAIMDSVNLASCGPLLGQEYLHLKIATPTFKEESAVIDFSENVFLIHSISTRKALGSGVQGYVLSFASQELIKNQRLKVTQSLTGSWSDLVEQMLRDNKYLNTTKNVLIERTAGVKRFVAPNIRPLDVVVLATKQAVSQKGGEPTFLFYETFDGFHFQSLASLYNKLPSFLFKTVQPGSNPPLGRRSDIAKQMQYDDIPIYSASKIDVDEPEPSGKFPLYDTYDFRPRVDDVTGASATLSTVDEITGLSFNFYSRSFGGTGGTTVDTPKPGSFVQADFEYYLPKFASLILMNKGDFKIIEGQSAENPLLPKVPDNCMLMATIFLPAYTFLPKNVSIRKLKNQRYTMKDIGKIAKRLDHVEYYTALSLLERDAESFEVTDANGLNRFKSGFVVDNFKGHRIGDTVHRDYKNSMDFELGQLRPKHKAKAVDLIESVSTDTARTAAGYKKTGDLITLPYSEITITEQPYATRTEKITALQYSSYIGSITLSPSSDTWFETEIIPELVVNEEGDYDAVLAQEANNLGSIWNSWQNQTPLNFKGKYFLYCLNCHKKAKDSFYG